MAQRIGNRRLAVLGIVSVGGFVAVRILDEKDETVGRIAGGRGAGLAGSKGLDDLRLPVEAVVSIAGHEAQRVGDVGNTAGGSRGTVMGSGSTSAKRLFGSEPSGRSRTLCFGRPYSCMTSCWV